MAEASKDPLVGTFGATGQSTNFTGTTFNISLSGFGTATVAVQRSFDQGATWVTVDSFTGDTQRRVDEPGQNVFWRFNCTSYTSGTIAYRMSA